MEPEWEDLPDELLLQQCQLMDVPTLSQFVQTSWRMYQVCKEVFQDKFGDHVNNMILANKVVNFKNNLGHFVIFIPSYFGEILYIKQSPQEAVWPFSRIDYINIIGYETIHREAEIELDVNVIKQLVKTLLDKGYNLVLKNEP